MSIAIACQKRPEGMNPRAIRREGLVPVVIYGHKGQESDADLVVSIKDAAKLLKFASVDRTVVEVSVPDRSWSGKALIREAQFHPWKALLYHLSFFVVDNQPTVDVSIPVRLAGDSKVVKQGGKLKQSLNQLKIQCAPDVIPAEIEIDITDLPAGTRLLVSDLVLPEGVTAKLPGNLPVLVISG